MKSTDEQLDVVLRALGRAEPDEDLEGRVLAALAQRDRQRAGGRQGGWVQGRRAWCLAAVIAVAVATGTVAGVRWTMREPARVTVPAASEARAQATAGAGAARPDAGAATDREWPASRGTPVGAAGGRRDSGRVERASAARGTGRMRRAGEEETRAKTAMLRNQPAPEEPLTEEERMLLRIARRGRPEEYAALDPGVQAQRMSAETAEFRRFFEPPTVKKDPPTVTKENQ